MHISALTPDPKNARKHSPRNVGTIVDALHEVGAARSIVIDDDNVILAGNATIEAAAEAGITNVQVVDADGQTIVAVRRTGLSPQQKAKLALYDNRAAELADGWDANVLKALQDDGVDLSKLWSADELSALMEAETGPKAGRTDPDEVPAERATDIQRGDLFELGRHRLLCGDSTKAGDVDRVMAVEKAALVLTDPPYPREFDGVWIALGEQAIKVCRSDAFLVTLCGHYQLPWVLNTILAGGWAFYWIAIAANNNQPIMHGYSVKCAFKPCLVFRKGAGHPRRIWIDNFALRTKTEDWQQSQQAHKWGQATALWYEPLEAFSEPGSVIYEPFLGGGTTLIACELYTSLCRAIELEPVSCQVSIDRWEAFTGQHAVKVGEAVRPAAVTVDV